MVASDVLDEELAYQVTYCFLGILRSNWRSEGLNSTLNTHLDGKISLYTCYNTMSIAYEECA